MTSSTILHILFSYIHDSIIINTLAWVLDLSFSYIYDGVVDQLFDMNVKSIFEKEVWKWKESALHVQNAHRRHFGDVSPLNWQVFAAITSQDLQHSTFVYLYVLGMEKIRIPFLQFSIWKDRMGNKKMKVQQTMENGSMEDLLIRHTNIC